MATKVRPMTVATEQVGMVGVCNKNFVIDYRNVLDADNTQLFERQIRMFRVVEMAKVRKDLFSSYRFRNPRRLD